MFSPRGHPGIRATANSKRSLRPDGFGSVVLVAFAVPMTVAMLVPLATVIPIALAVTAAAALPIVGHVLFFVPAILHEIDRLATGVILATVLTPVFRVPRRNV